MTLGAARCRPSLGVGNVWLILALVAVQSGAFAIASSARGAIIPRIVDADLVPAANTLNFTVGNVGQVIGPLIAGRARRPDHGFAYAYGIDAVLFTAALYSALRLPPIPPDREPRRRSGCARSSRACASSPPVPVLIMSFLVDIVRDGARHAARAVPGGCRRPLPRQRSGRCTPRSRSARCSRGCRAAGSAGCGGRARADLRDRRAGALAVAVSGLAHSAVAGRRAARRRRRRRPGQRGLPADDPADLRAGRDARPHAGRVHRRRRRRPAPGRRARRCAPPSATSATFSWVGGGVACMVVVAIAGVLVRPFWRYDAQATLRRTCGALASAHGAERTQFAIAAGEHEATIVEVGAGLRSYTRRGVDVTVAVSTTTRCRRSAAARCSSRGRTGCARGRYTLRRREPAAGAHRAGKRQRHPRARPLGALDAGACTSRPGHAARSTSCRRTGYPFEMRVEVTYALHAELGLSVSTSGAQPRRRRRAVRRRVPPVPVDARRAARRRRRCGSRRAQRLVLDDAQIPVGRAVGRAARRTTCAAAQRLDATAHGRRVHRRCTSTDGRGSRRGALRPRRRCAAVVRRDLPLSAGVHPGRSAPGSARASRSSR